MMRSLDEEAFTERLSQDETAHLRAAWEFAAWEMTRSGGSTGLLAERVAAVRAGNAEAAYERRYEGSKEVAHSYPLGRGCGGVWFSGEVATQQKLTCEQVLERVRADLLLLQRRSESEAPLPMSSDDLQWALAWFGKYVPQRYKRRAPVTEEPWCSEDPGEESVIVESNAQGMVSYVRSVYTGRVIRGPLTVQRVHAGSRPAGMSDEEWARAIRARGQELAGREEAALEARRRALASFDEAARGVGPRGVGGVVDPSGRVGVAHTVVPSEVVVAAASGGVGVVNDRNGSRAVVGVVGPSGRVGVAHAVVPSEVGGVCAAGGDPAPAAPGARAAGEKDLAGEVKKLEAEFLAAKRAQQGARSRAQSAGAAVRAAVGTEVGSGGKSREEEALASSSWEQ
jgi:hypothetical protein